MVDVNDDLANAKPPFKVVACIPVFGRKPLLEHTIRRLYQKNGVHKVICAGDQHEDRKLCESLGAHWVAYKNKPLGMKWNAAFQAAEQFNPDACLFVGSSDWISDNWIYKMEPLVKEFDLIGTAGCYFLHIGNDFKLCDWPGYEGRRKGESIGIGRTISRKLLDKLHFKPFEDNIDSSLDYSMISRSNKVAAKVHMTVNAELKSLSISTDRWHNKHNFMHHWTNVLKSEIVDNPEPWLKENFPEAFNVFK